MQNSDILDWELEEAKNHLIKIPYDFDTRMRIWKSQVLPDRLNAIRQYDGNQEYVYRMANLLHHDKLRLFNRAQKEYADNPILFDIKIGELVDIVTKELLIYQNEIKVIIKVDNIKVDALQTGIPATNCTNVKLLLDWKNNIDYEELE